MKIQESRNVTDHICPKLGLQAAASCIYRGPHPDGYLVGWFDVVRGASDLVLVISIW